MADFCDHAQQETDGWIQRVLERRELARKKGPSAIYCELCGDEIPEQRRQAVPGCTLCVVCQEQEDRQ